VRPDVMPQVRVVLDFFNRRRTNHRRPRRESGWPGVKCIAAGLIKREFPRSCIGGSG
jgi:hypothetical protein